MRIISSAREPISSKPSRRSVSCEMPSTSFVSFAIVTQ